MGRNSVIRISVLADTNRAQRALADLGTEAAGLGKVLALPAVVPALAAASAGVLELGTALTVAAGAASVFALSAGGIIKDMLNAQKAIDTQRTKLAGLTKGTSAYADQVKVVRTMQQSFNQEFGPAAKGYNDLGFAFTRFKDKTSGVTDKVLKQAFEGLVALLPRLVPLSDEAGKAVGGLLTDLKHFTAGKGFSDFLHTLETSGVSNITRFGHIIGNTISGVASILKNFVKPGDQFTKSIEEATKRFAIWAKSPGVSKGISDFLGYVHDNAPTISAALLALVDILPKLADSFGGLGSVDLKAITFFLTLLASLPQNVFDVIVTGTFAIIALVKVIKIWTAAQAILDVALTANPIGLLVVAIVGLGVAFTIAFLKIKPFRDFIEKHWAPLLIGMAGPVGLVAVLIIKNFDKIVAAIQVLGGWARWLWNNAFQPAIKFIVNAVGLLLKIWGKMLSALGHVPGFGWAKSAGDAMQFAADKALAIADAIHKIPSGKTVDVVLNVVRGVLHTTGGNVPLDPGMSNPKNLLPTTKSQPQKVYNITIAPTPLSTPYEQGEAIVAAIREFESASAT